MRVSPAGESALERRTQQGGADARFRGARRRLPSRACRCDAASPATSARRRTSRPRARHPRRRTARCPSAGRRVRSAASAPAAAPRGTRGSAARGRRRRALRGSPQCDVARSERPASSCPVTRDPHGCILRPAGGPAKWRAWAACRRIAARALPRRRQRLHLPRLVLRALEFADRDGNPVNAVHGFARFLGDLLERESPAHVAVAFDESLETSYRNEIYPAYKANREPAPAELEAPVRPVPRAGARARRRGVRQLALRGRRHHRHARPCAPAQSGMPVTIASRDKDLTQLVGSHDTYWDAVADVRYGYDDIAERFGVHPRAHGGLPRAHGRRGGQHPRRAGRRPQDRGDAAQALRHAARRVRQPRGRAEAQVPQCCVRRAESLREHRESAFLSRQLTGIACDMPLAVGPGELARRAPDLAALDEFYELLGFGRLLREQARRIARGCPAT